MNILVFGAGRSSSALINYLLQHAEAENWTVRVADVSLAASQAKVKGHLYGRAMALDINNADARADLIEAAACVVSLLPPSLHDLVAADCLRLRKNLVTASYLSATLRAMAADVAMADLLFMGEMGLDPGIDHLSAMQIIDEIEAEGGKVTDFRSYTGGLVAPECVGDNPWGYKFSWNPKNVVTAGQGVAQFRESGKTKYIPYQQVFDRAETIAVEGMGDYDGYANRDSLGYLKTYNLEHVDTLVRGTLRKSGYCKAWQTFVLLGMCDDTYKINVAGKTYTDFLELFLKPNKNSLPTAVADFIADKIGDTPEENAAIFTQIQWLGFFENQPIALTEGTPAEILLSLLLEKWKLEDEDKDMVIMQHEFHYILKNKKYFRTSTLVVKGEDDENTAMAKLVGLPMAILVRLLIQGKIALRGVHIPVQKEIYTPVLKELAACGVVFVEKITQI
jgi:saccharopine dehydrogenase-like NADP-dependent oxidoreductase